jgi:hypothetical protein
MGPLLVALIPVIEGLAAGTPLALILSGLTIAQWVQIAAGVATLVTPIVEADAPKVLTFLENLHPAFSKLIADVKSVGPSQAATNAQSTDWVE